MHLSARQQNMTLGRTTSRRPDKYIGLLLCAVYLQDVGNYISSQLPMACSSDKSLFFAILAIHLQKLVM